MPLSLDIIYAIASRSLCDYKSVKRWARGGKERARMKPMCKLRIERAVAELGISIPEEKASGANA